MSNLNADSARCERTDPGCESSLAIADARYALVQRLRAAKATFEDLDLRQPEALEVAARLCEKIGQQAKALRERIRRSEGVHGEDPAQAEVAEAPIACIRVGDDDSMEVVHLYAPGLPAGTYDLYINGR